MAKKVAFGGKPEKKPAALDAEAWVESGQGEATKRFTIDVPESLHRRIKAQCAERGSKMADVVRELLEKHFPAKA
jgi:hypothetical protein